MRHHGHSRIPELSSGWIDSTDRNVGGVFVSRSFNAAQRQRIPAQR
jgi:hypothetical protein